MKAKLLIVLISMCFTCLGQKDSSFIIKKMPSISKKNTYSEVRIKVYDAYTKEKLLPIIRVDGVSFSQCDTSFSTFFLTKGKHVLQVGWLGYLYSNKIKLNTQLSEDYEIGIYIKPDKKPLY